MRSSSSVISKKDTFPRNQESSYILEDNADTYCKVSDVTTFKHVNKPFETKRVVCSKHSSCHIDIEVDFSKIRLQRLISKINKDNR